MGMLRWLVERPGVKAVDYLAGEISRRPENGGIACARRCDRICPSRYVVGRGTGMDKDGEIWFGRGRSSTSHNFHTKCSDGCNRARRFFFWRRMLQNNEKSAYATIGQ